ncbi:MAG: hypothetical protein J6I50_04380 [Clostridia bacterium]|nr:hypothetical protein [Clostridia bacterium]
MFTLEKDDCKVGAYLRQTIYQKYDSIRKFCRAYLELKDGSTNDEEIRKLLNRFSQILKGVKRLQIDDLPYTTELLEVSCEEILSAGKVHVPISSHMTNYDIAFSHDRELWERYMKREDKLFLNCDEYCKSVIDYALEFKNYDFIKYLISEKFIWFVDISKWGYWGFTYGAGTSVERREIGYIDTHTPLEIQYQDELRIKTIALAIENEDFDILDLLLAREMPKMHQASMTGYPDINLQERKNMELIHAIALSNDQIINYFSQEFIVKNQQKEDNTFLFPYLTDVIEEMLINGKTDSAELCIRRAISHNKKAFETLTKLIKKSYEFQKESLEFDTADMEDYLMQQTLYNFRFDTNNNIVSFFYNPAKYEHVGFVTNIIHAESKYGTPLIKELLQELNETFDKIVALKGDE